MIPKIVCIPDKSTRLKMSFMYDGLFDISSSKLSEDTLIYIEKDKMYHVDNNGIIIVSPEGFPIVWESLKDFLNSISKGVNLRKSLQSFIETLSNEGVANG